MLEGTVGVGAIGIELAVDGGGQVLTFLRRTGMRGDTLLIRASGAVGTFVTEIDCDSQGCGRRLVAVGT